MRFERWLAAPAALLWAAPFAWMAVASLRPGYAADIASLWPAGPLGAGNIEEAWQDGHFPLWYLNTVLLCAGILLVQLVTVSLAGYAFARLRFPGERLVFAAFLLQLLLVPTLLIVSNLSPRATRDRSRSRWTRTTPARAREATCPPAVRR